MSFSGAMSFTDQVHDFLSRMDPRNTEAEAPRLAPLPGAADLPPDAPTDAEVEASWHETVMPDFDEYDGSCGCGDEKCAGAC